MIFANIGNIRYEMLSQANLEGTIRCVSRAFTRNEPMSRHLGISYKEFLYFARHCYPVLIEQELSLVAVDTTRNEVIGARISEDFYLAGGGDIPGLSNKFLPLFAMLEKLSNYYGNHRGIVKGRYVHMFMVAVDEAYTKQGIAPTMYRIFIRHALERGFTHAVTEPTGLISQHILRNKFGFRVVHEIPYQEFEYEGRLVFQNLKGHKSAMLMEKALHEIEIGRL